MRKFNPYHYKKLLLLLIVISFIFNCCYADVHADSPANEEYQVVEKAGMSTSNDGMVSVSKTIEGTDYENIFDITLQVQTKVNIETLYTGQDTDVVIVMDISYTMYQNKLPDGKTRYDAAIESAKEFIADFQSYAGSSVANCNIGYVAFNTDAHEIVSLTECKTVEQKNNIISDIEFGSDAIMTASGYSESYKRFTNIEAGLKMANDMLNASDGENKFVILLSDGFPTTYLDNNKSGYIGYNPYMNSNQNSEFASQSAGGIGSDGYFYNQKTSQLCSYGTSYSDKGATRAEMVANELKNQARVYSIGVGLDDQSIADFWAPVVDCYPSGQDYVIGDDTEGFKSWLRNDIGSGYYWDSTDTDGLESAYDDIFTDIMDTTEESIKDIWIATDPMSAIAPSNVEFLNFYDVEGNLIEGDLKNEETIRNENTANIDISGDVEYINWDLKNSVCEEIDSENQITYIYTLKYRIRLDTSREDFKAGEIYLTNGTTYLTYQVETDGVLSEPEEIEFKVPSVKGYTGSLEFTKLNGETSEALEGVEFTLTHSSECSVCNVTSNMEDIDEIKVLSDENGNVVFENIPSGHDYILCESATLEGFRLLEDEYEVKVKYGITEHNLPPEMTFFNYTEKYLIENRTLQITKKIKAEHLCFEKGDATFVFKVEGESTGVENVVYSQNVIFTEDYVSANTDPEGYVSKAIRFEKLAPGNYKVYEEESTDYILKDVTDIVNGSLQESEKTVAFDLVNNQSGSAVFVNAYNLTDITGTKTWIDDMETDRPDSITVILLQNGEVYKTTNTTAEQNWGYSFTDVPVINTTDNSLYSYSVSENAVDGYETSYKTVIDGVETSVDEPREGYFDIVNTQRVFTLGFTKTDFLTKDGIADVSFELYRLIDEDMSHDHGVAGTTDCWRSSGVFVSNDDGIVILNDLIPGVTYGLVEDVSNRYCLPSELYWTVSIDSGGNATWYTICDDDELIDFAETYRWLGYSPDVAVKADGTFEISNIRTMRSVTAVKRIKTSDINFANGNPAFLFKLTGTDVTGEDRTYYRSVEFTESYVNANTDASGYVTLSAVFDEVVAGSYVLSEEEVSRYEFAGISNIVNGIANGESVSFDLITYTNGSATYTNKVYESQWFSHNDIVTNHF